MYRYVGLAMLVLGILVIVDGLVRPKAGTVQWIYLLLGGVLIVRGLMVGMGKGTKR